MCTSLPHSCENGLGPLSSSHVLLALLIFLVWVLFWILDYLGLFVSIACLPKIFVSLSTLAIRMYACIMNIWVIVCTYECKYVFMNVSVYACIFVCIYLCAFVCMYVCMYLCMYVSIYVFMYVLIYVCTYIFLYEYIEGCI